MLNSHFSKLLARSTFSMYIIVLLLASSTHKTIFLRPQSVHQWRQADCASQSLNYHQNDISLWTPQLHNQAGKNGYAAAELPILYYITAKLYDTFGFHEYLHRGLHLLIAIISWWFLFRIGAMLIGNEYLALFPVIIFSTTPFYYYYANNFLPNVPAVGFVIIGWYAFFRYAQSQPQQVKWLYIMGAFMALASLVKASEAISFVAIICLVIIGQFPFKWASNIKLPKKHILHFILICFVVIGLAYSWYSYARYFNGINGNRQSLIGIYPMWEMNDEEWKLTHWMVKKVWSSHFHHTVIINFTVVTGLLFFLFWNKLHKQLKWITLILLLGVAAYSVLFLKAFALHDYYFLSILVYPVFLLITMSELLWRWMKEQNHYIIHWGVGITLTGLSILAIYQNSHIQWLRYNEKQFMSDLPPGSYQLEPYLRSLGISRTDKVVSLKDRSPNITLYLMNNPGYTQAFIGNDINIKHMQNLGTEYLIINDSSYLQKESIQPFLNKKIGYHKGVWIFDIRDDKK